MHAPQPEPDNRPLTPAGKILACIAMGIGFSTGGAVGVWACLAAGSPVGAVLLGLFLLFVMIAAIVSLARSGPHPEPDKQPAAQAPAAPEAKAPALNPYAQEGFLRRGRDIGTVA